jgi:maltose alpha-D-glucosyltransferase/alpha-amylase
VRTPMQWSLGPNAGFSQAPPEALYNPVIDDETYGYRHVSVAAQRCDPSSLLTRMREMLAVRKAHPAFGRGNLRILALDDRSVLAFLRRWGDETLLVVHNLSEETREVVLALPGAAGAPVDLFTEQQLNAAETVLLSLEPCGYRWLKLAANERGSQTP